MRLAALVVGLCDVGRMLLLRVKYCCVSNVGALVWVVVVDAHSRL